MTSEFRYSTADVAARLGCSPLTVRNRAKPLGLGIEIAGQTGYRFSEADVQALIAAMRPTAPTVTPRRRRRTRGVTA